MRVSGSTYRGFEFESGAMDHKVHVEVGVGAKFMLITQLGADNPSSNPTIQIPIADAREFFHQCSRMVTP